jgi:hypothetical protein
MKFADVFNQQNERGWLSKEIEAPILCVLRAILFVFFVIP